MRMIHRALLSLVTCVALAACSEHTVKTADRAVSPLIGTWTRDGGIPKPDPKEPRFMKLTFAADGKLKATYIAAGGVLATVIDQTSKVKHEDVNYTMHDASLHIVEGTSGREYTYRVDGNKLYLTPEGGSEASIFSRSSET